MKKSTIVVALGSFILVTAILCIGFGNKVYQKEKHFNSSAEVLNQVENNKLTIYNQKGEQQESNQFSECLSLRKRIAGSQIYYDSINNIQIQELNEKQKESIEENYKNCVNKFVNYSKKDNIEAVRFIANIKHQYDNSSSNEPQSRVIDLVFVDEGEGTVIDYIVDYSTNEGEEGKHHVKG